MSENSDGSPEDIDLEYDLANSVISDGVTSKYTTETQNSNVKKIMITLKQTAGQGNTPTWQVVARGTKRQRKHVSESSESQEFANSNRFNVLNQEEENSKTQNKEKEKEISKREPKPPPIFIPDVNSIEDFVTVLNQVVNTEDYRYKAIDSNGQLKIMANNADAYRKIVHSLDNANAS